MKNRYFSTHFGTYQVTGDRAEPHLEAVPDDPAPTRFGLNFLDLAAHESRVDQPMVRRGWLENDTETPRGADEFVAVSWDRATSLVASEIRRVSRDYGNRSIYAGSYGWASAGRFHHAQSQIKRMLNLAGGFTSGRHSYSYGTAGAFLPHVLGANYAGTNACAPSWDHVAAHTDCMIAFGLRLTNAQCDPGGVGRHTVESWLGAALDRGMRLIVVSPDQADAPQHPNAEHMAIRPNTDTALLLACAYELLRQNQIEREQIERITVGFARLEAYIQGDTDGIAKSPAWAASITGLSEAHILDFANALNAPTCLINMGWSLQRAAGGEQPYWMTIALAAMLGQIGKPGGGFAFGMGSVNSVGQPVRRLKAPGLDQGRNPVADFIPVAAIAHLLENPGGTLEYNGETLDLPDIRLVYWAGGNPFHHHQDLNRLRRAWQKPDTVIVHEPVWTATATHADIVLPSTLPFERDDIVVSSQDRTIVHNQAVTTAYGAARDDHAICAAIAAELGFESAFTDNRSVDQWLRHLYAGYRSRFSELPDYDAFRELGRFTLDADDGSPRSYVLLEDFISNPDTAPLATPSGKIELFSNTIADFNYSDCLGHASWIPPTEWLGGSHAFRHPLHLLSPQPANRLHSQLDSVGASQREKIDGREVATLARADAEARNIRPGDTIRLFNDRGACLAGAAVSDTLMPGVIVLPTGAWYTPDDRNDPFALDLAGNPNVVTRDAGSSRVSQGPAPNSCLVEADRYTAG